MNRTRSQQPQATPPLHENLYLLAMFAMLDTGAEGFAYFRQQDEPAHLERCESYGAIIPEDAVLNASGPSHNSFVVVSYPLRCRGTANGVLAFSFSSRTRADAETSRLVRHAAAIAKLWAAPSFAQTYLSTLQRIIALEMELTNSKIAAVVRGALSEGPDKDAGDAVIRHVETVLRPNSALGSLDEILQKLILEVEERSWIDQAKEMLQTAKGIPEWEAHSHLRKLSRQSRRPLVEVARQMVQEACTGRT